MLPPFRADHVGSLIRPQALIEAREEAETGGDRASLKRIQEQAIRDVVAMQEDIGLKLVTDGEYNRGAWHRDFLLRFDECAADPVARSRCASIPPKGRASRAPPSWQVAGKLARPKPIFVEDFRYLASIAQRDAEDHDPLAHHHALPRRARGDRHDRLSGHGRLLRRSRARLRRGDRRPRGSRLPLSPDRRGQPRLSVRPGAARAGEQYRRGPGLAAADLCEAVERHDRRPAGRHDGVHASVPRQLRRRLGGGGRLRAGRRAAVQRDRRGRLFPRIRLRRAPAASSRCASCPRARSRCSASSPPRARSSNPRTT